MSAKDTVATVTSCKRCYADALAAIDWAQWAARNCARAKQTPGLRYRIAFQ